MNFNRGTLLLSIFFFCKFVAYSQGYIEYYHLVHEGEYNYNEGNYKEAISLYDQAFSIAPPFGIDLYRMAKCQCLSNNTQQAKKYLRLTGKKYFLRPDNYFSRDSSILMKCLSVKQFKTIKSKMSKNCEEAFLERENSNTYKYILDTVSYFIQQDQKYRQVEGNPCIKEDVPGFNCDSIRIEWHNHDSLLQAQFIQFIRENGYPRIAGELSYVILLHFQEHHYLRSKQLLIKEADKGNIDPFFLGMMFERLDLLLYGKECTYFIWRQECHESTWDHIVGNRQAIGMSLFYNGPRIRGEYNKIKLPWVN